MDNQYHLPTVRVMLVRESAETKKQLTGASDVVDFLSYMANLDREHFVSILLDTKNNVLGVETVSIGIVNQALVHPRELFKAAILANATSLILAHNHPSGDPTPSIEDFNLTKRIVDASKILGIPVIDHVVIGAEGKYYSFKEKGAI